MAQKKVTASVVSQTGLAADVFSMWIASDIAREARPGQFVSIFSRDSARLLPRPISICEVNEREEQLRIVYRVVGAGTEEFSHYRQGEPIEIMGPLGNGFPLEAVGGERKAFLIGGGIGIPPMLELAKRLECQKQIILGYRDELFLHEEFTPYGDVVIATEDGSAGTKGNVMDAVRENHLTADVIFACGPTPMLRAVKTYAQDKQMECYLSLEEKMACGIGACLACVCKTSDVDEHSQVHNRRICKDGPVFRAEEVEL